MTSHPTGRGRIRFNSLKAALELTGLIRRMRFFELVVMTLMLTGSLFGLCWLEFRRVRFVDGCCSMV